MLKKRITDRNLLKLIGKWLNFGAIEDGRLLLSENGNYQGSIISPVLANVYLHEVLDRRSIDRHCEIKKVCLRQTGCEKNIGNGNLWASLIFGHESHENGSRADGFANATHIDRTNRQRAVEVTLRYPHQTVE